MKRSRSNPKREFARVALYGSFFLFLLFSMFWTLEAEAGAPAQQPTGSIPTVTSSPSSLMITPKTGAGAEEQVNIRAGPGRDYAKVGVLTIGQYAPALGRTPGVTGEGGDWILISYPGAPDGIGWVFAYVVDTVGEGQLPIVEPPAAPPPKTTPTIDPTLAARFIVAAPPTRPPTFTAPPPLAIPTYRASSAIAQAPRIPMGFWIIGMGVVGLFGVFISILRGR
ncbi:MAG: SH3 domain-containing protein [Chloroflexota bacterium]